MIEGNGDYQETREKEMVEVVLRLNNKNFKFRSDPFDIASTNLNYPEYFFTSNNRTRQFIEKIKTQTGSVEFVMTKLKLVKVKLLFKYSLMTKCNFLNYEGCHCF